MSTENVGFRSRGSRDALTRMCFWSGRRESNPHHQLGRLRSYHYTTPAVATLDKTAFVDGQGHPNHTAASFRSAQDTGQFSAFKASVIGLLEPPAARPYFAAFKSLVLPRHPFGNTVVEVYVT